jgi:hypothetical protein
VPQFNGQQDDADNRKREIEQLDALADDVELRIDLSRVLLIGWIERLPNGHRKPKDPGKTGIPGSSRLLRPRVGDGQHLLIPSWRPLRAKLACRKLTRASEVPTSGR